MTEAPRYLLERWRAELEALFEESERGDVLDWLTANHGRKRVVLVGSGFSRNARNPRSVSIPLWAGISNALASDLRVNSDAFDALSLADFYKRNLGESAFQQRLLSLLDDDAISPGEAHAALWDSNPEAVNTTNFLDNSDKEQLAAFATTSALFCVRATDVVSWLHDLVKNDDYFVRGMLLQSPTPPELFQEAKASMLRCPPDQPDIGDLVTLTILSSTNAVLDWNQVQEKLGRSWKGLPGRNIEA